MVFHDARGRYLTTSVTGCRVSTRAVPTTEKHHGDDQQNHDDEDDP